MPILTPKRNVNNGRIGNMTKAALRKFIQENSPSGSTTQFYLEDGDGTEVAVNNQKEVKFVEGGFIDINWTDTTPGSDGDPFDLTFTVTPPVTALNNATASRLVTVGSTTTELDGEANLTYDGTTFVVNDNMTVGSAGTGHDVTFHGETSGHYMYWDHANDKLAIEGTHDAAALDITDGHALVQDGKLIVGGSTPSNTVQINHTGADSDDGLLIARADASTNTGDLLGGIGFDSTDGNVPSTITEASAYIAAYAAEAHATTDKGGYLVFGTTLINENDDTVSNEVMRVQDDGRVSINYVGDTTEAAGVPSLDLYSYSYTATHAPAVRFLVADHTYASPNSTDPGTDLGTIEWHGYNDNDSQFDKQADIFVEQVDNKGSSDAAAANFFIRLADDIGTGVHNAFKIAGETKLVTLYGGATNITTGTNYANSVAPLSITGDTKNLLLDANQIEVSGDNTLYVNYVGGGNFDACVGGGSVRMPGGGSWASTSDRRVKKDILDFDDGLDVIANLSPVKYKYNGKGGMRDNEKEYIGMIAQDVETHAPYMVWQEGEFMNPDDVEKTDIYQFDPSALVYLCLNAIKELKQRIEELEGGS